MHAQIVAVNVSGDGHGLEGVNELLIDVLFPEFLEYFATEREMFGHGPRLVVTAEHDHCLGVVELHKR